MINELDGLAKGPEMEHRAAGYARQVQERARKSIEFLEERFESRDNCLRALTSRGNELESISFRSEDTTGQQVMDIPALGTPGMEGATPRAGGSVPTFAGSEQPHSLLNYGRADIGVVGLQVFLPDRGNVALFFQGNNDDLILSCCLHYCNDKAKDFMPSNKGRTSSRLFVLPVAFHGPFSFLVSQPLEMIAPAFCLFQHQGATSCLRSAPGCGLPPRCQMCPSPHFGDTPACEKPP